MASRVHLLLDGNNLCHRALYTTGRKQLNGQTCGVVFGFFRSLQVLLRRFQPDYLVLAFDDCTSDKLFRTKLFPGYKKTRREKVRTSSELELKSTLFQQERAIRSIFSDVGCGVAYVENYGFEADDWLAVFTRSARIFPEDQVIIVSSDEDLFQLINARTTVYNPTKDIAYTLPVFQRMYGYTPDRWIERKAICGCKTDDIPNASRIGETIADNWLSGRKVLGVKAKGTINAWRTGEQYVLNRKLVQLPFSTEIPPDIRLNKNYPTGRWAVPKEFMDTRSLLAILEPYGITEI